MRVGVGDLYGVVLVIYTAVRTHLIHERFKVLAEIVEILDQKCPGFRRGFLVDHRASPQFQNTRRRSVPGRQCEYEAAPGS